MAALEWKPRNVVIPPSRPPLAQRIAWCEGSAVQICPFRPKSLRNLRCPDPRFKNRETWGTLHPGLFSGGAGLLECVDFVELRFQSRRDIAGRKGPNTIFARNDEVAQKVGISALGIQPKCDGQGSPFSIERSARQLKEKESPESSMPIRTCVGVLRVLKLLA